jgi:RHS repeat-associated protein
LRILAAAKRRISAPSSFLLGALTMKTYATLAFFVTLLATNPIAQAQACYSPVISWQGSFGLSADGTVSCAEDDVGTCTISQAAMATVNANLPTISCNIAVWSGTDNLSTAQMNNKAVIPCGDGTSENETVDSAGGGNSTSMVIIEPAAGTYSYFPAPVVNWHQVIVNCDGGTETDDGTNASLFPPSKFPLFLPLPSTVQTLTATPAPIEDYVDIEGAMAPFTFTFSLTPVIHEDRDCKKKGGSTIGCQNQSLGEDVPIVGTGFSLHYEGSRVPLAGGDPVASADAAMIGGWTLSVHHVYDAATNTLFLGDGSQRSGYQVGTPVSFNGNNLITSEDGSEVYVFSATNGRHLQTLWPMTGAVEYKFTYDKAGNLVKVADAKGNVTTIQRDASEHPTAIVSPFGQTTTVSVDSNGFLMQVTDPLGISVSFTNSSAGLLTARADGNGNIYNYTYDGNGRLIKDADPIGGYTGLTRTNAASGLGSTVAQTTAMGVNSSFQNALQVSWVQDGSSPFSEQRTMTWPDGLQATFSQTQLGTQRTEALTLPDGTSYDETMGPDPVWGIQVPITTSETLTQGSLTMNTTRSRATTLGTAGNPFSVSSRTDTKTVNGRTYTTVFTGSNREYVNTSPVGRTLTVALDSLERVASTQLGGLNARSFTYDSKGRPSVLTQGARKTTFSYGADGFLASITDPIELKTSFTYDADGRLLTTTLPDGRAVNYTYDANGNLTSVTPPGKSAHDFTYSAVDLLSTYTPPTVLGAGATAYNYDLDRRLTSVNRPDGQTISFSYDTGGRLTLIGASSGTISLGYDAATGNLITAAKGSEHLKYGYNGPLPTKSTWTGPVAGNVSRGYNNNFWITSQTVGGGGNIAMSYDNDGLLTKAGSLTIKRNSSNGLVTSATLGVTSDNRTYNGFGELVGYTALVNGAAVYKVQYTRDQDSRVTAKTETIGSTTNTYSYSYDLAGRLTAVAKNAATDSYTYDTNSNRLSATTSSGTANGSYDAQDRLLKYGTTTYTYSSNGELASQKAGSQNTSYKYDALGNLTSVTLPNATKLSYIMDAENHRVGKQVNSVLTTGFLYDDDRVVAQLNGSSQLVSQFVYGTSSETPDYMVSGGVTYRLFSDQLGSPVLVVNSSTGTIAEQITYDEFGNVLGDSNPGFQPFGFAGGLYDQDTKLIRFGARDYNPSVGRWTAKDPIRFSGGDANLYGYVLEDPVNWIDPSGLDAECKACDEQAKKAVTKTMKMWVKSAGGTDSDKVQKGIEKEVGKPSAIQEWKNANERSQKTADESASSLWKSVKDAWGTCTQAVFGN